jgi:hypothetical protein
MPHSRQSKRFKHKSWERVEVLVHHFYHTRPRHAHLSLNAASLSVTILARCPGSINFDGAGYKALNLLTPTCFKSSTRHLLSLTSTSGESVIAMSELSRFLATKGSLLNGRTALPRLDEESDDEDVEDVPYSYSPESPRTYPEFCCTHRLLTINTRLSSHCCTISRSCCRPPL